MPKALPPAAPAKYSRAALSPSGAPPVKKTFPGFRTPMDAPPMTPPPSYQADRPVGGAPVGKAVAGLLPLHLLEHLLRVAALEGFVVRQALEA